jgi:hypothetical protein
MAAGHGLREIVPPGDFAGPRPARLEAELAVSRGLTGASAGLSPEFPVPPRRRLGGDVGCGGSMRSSSRECPWIVGHQMRSLYGAFT